MSDLRRRVGFLSSIAEAKAGALIWPEGAVAIAITTGAGIPIVHLDSTAERISLVGDGLLVLGVLLGVVFAAFALLIALLSDDYVKTLNQANDGIIAFFRPFVRAVGMQITTIFVSLGYRALAGHLTSAAENGAFLTWLFLISYVLTDILALTRAVTMHGLMRAGAIQPKGGADVRPIRGTGSDHQQ